MASQDLLNALDNLGITDANQRTQAQTAFTTVGIKPGDLMAHTEKKSYILTGISPKEFMRKHGGL